MTQENQGCSQTTQEQAYYQGMADAAAAYGQSIDPVTQAYYQGMADYEASLAGSAGYGQGGLSARGGGILPGNG